MVSINTYLRCGRSFRSYCKSSSSCRNSSWISPFKLFLQLFEDDPCCLCSSSLWGLFYIDSKELYATLSHWLNTVNMLHFFFGVCKWLAVEDAALASQSCSWWTGRFVPILEKICWTEDLYLFYSDIGLVTTLTYKSIPLRGLPNIKAMFTRYMKKFFQVRPCSCSCWMKIVMDRERAMDIPIVLSPIPKLDSKVG